MFKIVVFCVGLLGLFCSYSQSVLPDSQIIRQSELINQSNERIDAINRQLFPQKESRINTDGLKTPVTLDTNQASSCFITKNITIKWLNNLADKVARKRAQSKINKALKKSLLLASIKVSASGKKNYYVVSDLLTHKPPCLSLDKIQKLSALFQNELISKGLVTSRVLIPSQDLKTKNLVFGVSVGLINKIKWKKEENQPANNHSVSFWGAFPKGKNDVLNLRDIEQGVENLSRLSTVTANMDIVPSERPGDSDIVVSWYQKTNPFTLAFSLDNSGSDDTGEILGTFNFAWENPLKLSDRFSVSYTRNISSGKAQVDTQGRESGKTYSYSLGYSVPLKYFLLDFSLSKNDHNQIVAGLNNNINYGGNTRQFAANVSKVLYRDNRHKVSAKVGVWGKTVRNFINDVEVGVQRRREGGWRAELSHTGFFEKGTLTSTLSYKRGTRLFDATEAPEELFGEGTAKPKIWSLDIDWNMPFSMGKNQFVWNSRFKAQTNQRLLTSQDKFSIGSRYNVRGFSGNRTLRGDKGWYIRNDISWDINSYIKPYLGLDYGQVLGPSSESFSDNKLSGFTIGSRGRIGFLGGWYYDVFISRYIEKPSDFIEDEVFFGFNLNYTF